MRDFEHCYDVLGLTSGADRAAIRRAYAQLAKIHRPDTSPAQFQELRSAYERALTLLDGSTQANITSESPATELSYVPLQASIEEPPRPPSQPADFSGVSWPEYLIGKKLASQFKVDVSEQQQEIENFKQRIIGNLDRGGSTDLAQKAAIEMFANGALINIELRLATENWLIELGATDDRVSKSFMQWIAEKCGIAETSESSSTEPIRIAFTRKLSNLHHVERIKASADNDKNSAESIVIHGAGYVKLLKQLFQLKQPNARHKVDAVAAWLQNQFPSLDYLIDKPTATRWQKLRSIPTVSPLVLLFSLTFACMGLLALLPQVASATVTFLLFVVLAGSLPLALISLKIIDACAHAVKDRIGAPYSFKFGVFEIGLAFVCLACLPLYKQHPDEVFYLGIALAFVTLVHSNLNGLLRNHLGMALNQIWAVCLGFLVLMWLAYVGMGGLSDVKHSLGFLGLLPALLSASAALYNVFWQTAPISRDDNQYLYLRNKRLMQPKPIWLSIIFLQLNLMGLNQVFTTSTDAVATSVGIVNLWLFYCTISIVGIQSMKQNHAVVIYVFFVALGAIFMGHHNTFILPGSFAVSVISTAIMGDAIWRNFLRPWLASKKWLKASKQPKIPPFTGLTPKSKQWFGVHWFWWLIIVSTIVRLLSAIAQS
jgi:DnaJ domain